MVNALVKTYGSFVGRVTAGLCKEGSRLVFRRSLRSKAGAMCLCREDFGEESMLRVCNPSTGAGSGVVRW